MPWGAEGLRGLAVQWVPQEGTRIGAESGCAVGVGLFHSGPQSSLSITDGGLD